jgi:hypothetical protein
LSTFTNQRGRDADGDEHGLDLELRLGAILREVELHALVPDADVLALGVRVHRDALLDEAALKDLADLLVLNGQDLREHLDERDLRAEGVEEIRELHADGAGTDDGHRLRGGLGGERLAGGHHAGAVDRQARQRARLLAGAEEDVFRAEEFSLMLALGDLDHAGDGDGALANHVVDLVLLEQELDALGHLGGDAA